MSMNFIKLKFINEFMVGIGEVDVGKKLETK